MIRFFCPRCKAAACAPDDCAGRTSKCRQCGRPLTVPAARKPPATPHVPPPVRIPRAPKPGAVPSKAVVPPSRSPGGPRKRPNATTHPREPVPTPRSDRKRPATEPTDEQPSRSGIWAVFAVLLPVLVFGPLVAYGTYRLLRPDAESKVEVAVAGASDPKKSNSSETIPAGKDPSPRDAHAAPVKGDANGNDDKTPELPPGEQGRHPEPDAGGKQESPKPKNPDLPKKEDPPKEAEPPKKENPPKKEEPPSPVKAVAVLKGQAGIISGLAFSADGARLVSTCMPRFDFGQVFTGQAVVWDVAKQERVCVCQNPPALADPGFGSRQQSIHRFFVRIWLSPDGKTVIAAEMRAKPGRQSGPYRLDLERQSSKVEFQVWDGMTGKLRGALVASQAMPRTYTSAGFIAAAMSPDGESFAVAWDMEGRTLHEGHVAVWDLKTLKVKCNLPVPESIRIAPRTLAFSPDGTQLAVASVSFRELEGSGAGFVGLGTEDGGILKLWNLETAKETATLKGVKPNDSGEFSAPQLAWLSDSKTLILRRSTSVEIWTTAKEERQDAFLLVAPRKPVPEGSPLPSDAERLSWASGGQSVLSADGKRMLVYDITFDDSVKPPRFEHQVVIWDVISRRRRGILELPATKWSGGRYGRKFATVGEVVQAGSEQMVDHNLDSWIAVSPNSKLLAVGDAAGEVRLYDVAQIEANTKIEDAKPSTDKPKRDGDFSPESK
jgi:WD40 repeat protein